MQEYLEKIVQPIFISILTFCLGVLSKEIYDRKMEKKNAYVNFYIPLIKIIVAKQLFSLSTNSTTISELKASAFEELINLSFNNLQYMNQNMQTKFISFCSIWIAYQTNTTAENYRSLLMTLRLYIELVLNEAQKNAKKIKKSIPTSVTAWVISYINNN